MARMSNPTYIKITVTSKEVEAIDSAIRNGYGMSRADFCRKALNHLLGDHVTESSDAAEAVL